MNLLRDDNGLSLEDNPPAPPLLECVWKAFIQVRDGFGEAFEYSDLGWVWFYSALPHSVYQHNVYPPPYTTLHTP